MKKIKRHNRIIASIMSLLLVASILVSSIVTVFADEVKIVTLGEDLDDEQRQLILEYFNVDENEVEIVNVNNEDEHSYLDGIATQQQIGTHTYSCTYIEPTHEGGIHIKTVNLNWVTCEMIRNALITSGITNCNVICAAPKEVSGTGALTGIFKAYQKVVNEDLDNEKVELASQELVQTMSLAETVGQEEATELISNVKEEVIVNDIKDENDIATLIDKCASENNIQLTEEQKGALVKLMSQIAQQEYSAEDIKNAYEDVMNKVEDMKDTATEAKNILEKIMNFFVELFQKITGTYDKIKESEEADMIKEQLGILAETNDSILGSNTVVTVTEDNNIIDKITDKEEEIKENNKGVIDKIIGFFKELFGANEEEATTSSSETSETSETQEDTNKIEPETNNTEQETKSDNENVLDSVTWEMQNGEQTQENNGTPSLDELTK